MGGLVAEHVVSLQRRTPRLCLTPPPAQRSAILTLPRLLPAHILKPPKSEPKRLRIAFTTRAVDGEIDPECKAASEAAAKLCAKLGHHVEEGRPQPPAGDEANFRTNFITIWSAGLAMLVEYFAKALGRTPAREDFEGLTWGFYQYGKTISAAHYQSCWTSLQASSRQVARWQQPYDAWITPVLGRPPLEIGALNLDETDVMKGLAPILGYVPFTGGQRDRPAGHQPATRVVEVWLANRRTICRSLWRRALAAAACGPNREGSAVEQQATAGLRLTKEEAGVKAELSEFR